MNEGNGIESRALPWRDYAVFCLVAVAVIAPAMAAVSIYLGQDQNYDQRNYHLYDGYSYYTGRFGKDYVVADIHTFLSPIIHTFQYLLITTFRPVVAGATMGAIHSLNLVAAGFVALLLTQGSRPLRFFLAALAMMIAASSPMFLSEIGTTLSDIWTGPLVVVAAGLIAYAPGRTERRSALAVAVAGLLLGLSAAVKLTNGVFALAGAACILVTCIRDRRMWLPTACFAACGILGFGLAGGEWTLRLWTNFSNPVFPFFNGLFKSPDYYPFNIKDGRFGAQSVLQLLSGPWDAATGSLASAEIPFRDGRMLALTLLVLLALAYRRRGASWNWALASLLLFSALSYLLWYSFFGIQRYALPLEILAGPLCVLLLARLLRPKPAAIAGLVLASCLAVWVRTDSWGRVAWASTWQNASLSSSIEGTKLFVFLDPPSMPVSSVALALPADASFIRLGGHVPLRDEGTMHDRLMRILATARDQKAMALFVERPVPSKALEQLQQIGLTMSQECTRITVQQLPLEACPLEWRAR